MKLSAIFFVAFALLGGNIGAKAAPVLYVKRTYIVSATHTHPLGPYRECNRWSHPGQTALGQAYNEALLQCEIDDNTTCNYIGAKYSTQSSLEFPGYKTCTVIVTVQGFGPQAKE